MLECMKPWKRLRGSGPETFAVTSTTQSAARGWTKKTKPVRTRTLTSDKENTIYFFPSCASR